MDDIVERLKEYDCPMCAEGAAYIERALEVMRAMHVQLQITPCLCNMNKCRCGHDAILDIYEEEFGNAQHG